MLPLPPEDDPDTFVRSPRYTEVEEYIKQNETDFINFKTNVVLKDAQNDPIKRTAAITDVVKSIAIIPDEIARMVYAKECSGLFDMDEQTILRQIKHYRGKYIEQWEKERQQQKAREQRMRESGLPIDEQAPLPPPLDYAPAEDQTSETVSTSSSSGLNTVTVQEREVIKLIVNYGMCYLCNTLYDDVSRPTTVLEYINNELMLDQMEFSDPLYAHTFKKALQYIEPFYRDLESFNAKAEEQIEEYIKQEMAKQDDEEPEAMDSAGLINAQERKLKSAKARATLMVQNELQDFRCSYLQRALCSIDDTRVRQLSCDIATESLPQLSKIHTQFAVIVEDRDRLLNLVPDRLYNWKNALLSQKINNLKTSIANASPEQLPQLMEQLQELYKIRHKLASYIGDRVVNPK